MRRTAAGRLVAAAGIVALTACTAPADPPVEVAQTPPATAVVSTAASDVRVTLEALFGLHAYQVTAATGASGRAGTRSYGALERTTGELADALAEVYGADAADRFADHWSDYVTVLRGLRADTSANRVGRARRVVEQTATELGEHLSTISDGILDAGGLSALLQEPMTDLVAHVEAAVARDHPRAWTHAREAYAGMITVGRTVAAGIVEQFPDRYPGARASASAELRSALAQLLGEHTLLSATVMRKGARGARDFQSAADALNGNTDDLLTAFDSLYGQAASALEGPWRDRIAALADFAAAGDRRPARRAARQAMDQAADDFGAHVDELSESTVSAAEITGALQRHDAGLRRHLQQHLGAAFDEAQTSLRAVYATGADLATTLSEAIIAQRPDEFPTD